eukprot:COSAG05_NODE_522_length_9020_cov_18.531891_5_plen_368_part_00
MCLVLSQSLRPHVATNIVLTYMWSCCRCSKGTWGGDVQLDECGVCSGDGKGCRGCDGRPNSGKKKDACGVCGGDNSKCRDCAGVPNGKARKDMCGKCDADPGTDCKLDCAGKWGGKSVRDKCGTCDANPDNDCLPDCAGKYGGTKKRDKCGVCGGKGGPCVCNRVQKAIIGRCKKNCNRCRKSQSKTGGRVNKILDKCTLTSGKHSQVFGVTFCKSAPEAGHGGNNKPVAKKDFHPTKFWSKETQIGSMLSADGHAIKGEITYIMDGKQKKTTHVWYFFNALEGKTYELETKAGTLEDTVMQLVGPDEITTLAENDNDERVSGSTTSFLKWKCPADAGYFLVVSSGDGKQVGTYTVSVKKVSSAGGR